MNCLSPCAEEDRQARQKYNKKCTSFKVKTEPSGSFLVHRQSPSQQGSLVIKCVTSEAAVSPYFNHAPLALSEHKIHSLLHY